MCSPGQCQIRDYQTDIYCPILQIGEEVRTKTGGLRVGIKCSRGQMCWCCKITAESVGQVQSTYHHFLIKK